MKTFNKIKSLIEHGHWLACESKHGRWKVFMFVNGKGQLEGTVPTHAIENCIESGLSDLSCTQDEFEEYFTDNYKVVTPAPKLLKPGDKVEILENVREYSRFDYRSDEEKEMIGQKGLEIKNVYVGDYWIYKKDKTSSFCFPHWAVAPVFDTPKQMTKEQIEEELGFKIDMKKIIKIVFSITWIFIAFMWLGSLFWGTNADVIRWALLLIFTLFLKYKLIDGEHYD